MSELSNKILKLFEENEIPQNEISQTLLNIQNEIEFQLWEKITISPIVFYKLKDTVFYNFEYCFYNDNQTGKTDLKTYGKNYPVLMYYFNNSEHITKENVEKLKDELEDIRKKWNQNIFLANLYTKVDFDWKVGEDDPSKLIIYNKVGETPMTYGYYNNTHSNIYDTNGQFIKYDENIVLCSIEKMDLYREYNLLTQTLDNLYNTIQRAFENGKGLSIDFDGYDYQ